MVILKSLAFDFKEFFHDLDLEIKYKRRGDPALITIAMNDATFNLIFVKYRKSLIDDGIEPEFTERDYKGIKIEISDYLNNYEVVTMAIMRSPI